MSTRILRTPFGEMTLEVDGDKARLFLDHSLPTQQSIIVLGKLYPVAQLALQRNEAGSFEPVRRRFGTRISLRDSVTLLRPSFVPAKSPAKRDFRNLGTLVVNRAIPKTPV